MGATGPGSFHWNELMTRDVAGAKAFYGDVCGWTFMDMPFDGMTYVVAMAAGEPAGGIYDISGADYEGQPECWMSYVAVDDADAAAARVTAAGGTVVQAPFDVTGVGRIAMLVDKNGAMLGVIKPSDQDA